MAKKGNDKSKKTKPIKNKDKNESNEYKEVQFSNQIMNLLNKNENNKKTQKNWFDISQDNDINCFSKKKNNFFNNLISLYDYELNTSNLDFEKEISIPNEYLRLQSQSLKKSKKRKRQNNNDKNKNKDKDNKQEKEQQNENKEERPKKKQKFNSENNKNFTFQNIVKESDIKEKDINKFSNVSSKPSLKQQLHDSMKRKKQQNSLLEKGDFTNLEKSETEEKLNDLLLKVQGKKSQIRDPKILKKRLKKEQSLKKKKKKIREVRERKLRKEQHEKRNKKIENLKNKKTRGWGKLPSSSSSSSSSSSQNKNSKKKKDNRPGFGSNETVINTNTKVKKIMKNQNK